MNDSRRSKQNDTKTTEGTSCSGCLRWRFLAPQMVEMGSLVEEESPLMVEVVESVHGGGAEGAGGTGGVVRTGGIEGGTRGKQYL